ncbi:hypothetical protein [Serratia marcescens]
MKTLKRSVVQGGIMANAKPWRRWKWKLSISRFSAENFKLAENSAADV